MSYLSFLVDLWQLPRSSFSRSPQVIIVAVKIRPLYHTISSGGFIYIATVSVIPELLEGATFRQSIMEVGACYFILDVLLLFLFFKVIALLLGVAMMVLITQFE